MAHKFVLTKDKRGEFRAKFVFNTETMFSSEGYSSKASAKSAIVSLQKNGPGRRNRRPDRLRRDQMTFARLA